MWLMRAIKLRKSHACVVWLTIPRNLIGYATKWIVTTTS
jgi:hypothetical protein